MADSVTVLCDWLRGASYVAEFWRRENTGRITKRESNGLQGWRPIAKDAIAAPFSERTKRFAVNVSQNHARGKGYAIAWLANFAVHQKSATSGVGAYKAHRACWP